MKKLSRIGQLWIFDMDGTLFNSISVAVPAFQDTLGKMRTEGFRVPAQISDEQILGTFGMTHDQIWKTLLGYELTQYQQQQADEWVLQSELERLREGEGMIFPYVKETLTTLHQEGAKLAVASNGQQPYIEEIVKAFGIFDLFSILYSAAGLQVKEKSELVSSLIRELHPEEAVMVGDRNSDIVAGNRNGIPTVGCVFGFANEGELVNANYIIHDFNELLALDPWKK